MVSAEYQIFGVEAVAVDLTRQLVTSRMAFYAAQSVMKDASCVGLAEQDDRVKRVRHGAPRCKPVTGDKFLGDRQPFVDVADLEGSAFQGC